MNRLTPVQSGPHTPPVPTQEQIVLSADGARLHVEVHGTEGAPAVVLVHSWACQAILWAAITRALAVDHRVVLYDQRGHGRSPAASMPGGYSTRVLADDLQAVLGAALAAEERVVLAGHSMGGMALMAAANREAVRKQAAAVLLCNTATSRLLTDSQVIPLRSERLCKWLHRVLLGSRASLGPITPITKRIFQYATMGPASTPEMVQACARVVHACPSSVRAGWERILADLGLDEQLAQLTMPIAVIAGLADRLTPPGQARRIAAALPHCVGLAEPPRLGHMTPEETPETIEGVIRSLVRDHLPAPGLEPVRRQPPLEEKTS
ncbi:alpha/beta hydrolase [Streptomyces sp. NPDC093982]|uniref:alpha/beta fold hydrolase n=1 Tax=Streptomyces sp. NPDC093982 TaxID=3155077 RepID=UPI003435305E